MLNTTGEKKDARGGLPVRSAVWMAALLGILVVGSAYLKARHLGRVAMTADWQSADFRLPRAAFSRTDTESDGGCPDERTRSLFMDSMTAYIHGEDPDARRGLLRTVKQAPDWPRARFYLGVTGLHLGHPMMASQNLRRALDEGFQLPDQTGDWWLGVAELYCGRRDEGRTLLRSVAAGTSPLAESAQEILQGLDHAATGEG